MWSGVGLYSLRLPIKHDIYPVSVMVPDRAWKCLFCTSWFIFIFLDFGSGLVLFMAAAHVRFPEPLCVSCHPGVLHLFFCVTFLLGSVIPVCVSLSVWC